MINRARMGWALCDDIRANFQPDAEHTCPSEECIKLYGRMHKGKAKKQLMEIMAQEVRGEPVGYDDPKPCPKHGTRR